VKCAFIFRRDLRIYDNTGLVEASYDCDEIIPLFIVDPRQMLHNNYKSEFASSFMINSLVELDAELRTKWDAKLNVFFGNAEEVIKKLDVNAIYVNEDYTPFAIQRDEKMRENALSKGIKFLSFTDVLLSPKELKPTRSFSAFYKKALQYKVREPRDVRDGVNFTVMEDSMDVDFLKSFIKVESPLLKGGRSEGLKLIDRKVDFKRRDYPVEKNYTMLSPHLKFGTLSIRETYYKKRDDPAFIRELYWRDFYTLLAYYNPYIFGHCYRREFDSINWENNEEYFEAWKQGRTGYPIVDAAMRALNNSGFINGRLRMIVAFFLTKVLFVDWRWGEKYFATKLIDYDPAINNGNWQWVASTGTDYIFRVFDPWKQQEKFDPEAKFIKEWIEELRDYPPSVIHKVYEYNIPAYPKPIVDWRERVELVKRVFRFEQ